MKLSNIINGFQWTLLQGVTDIDIHRLQYDSRQVAPGDVFVCITGFQTDGHKYAKQAAERGAVAIICERPVPDLPDTVTAIQTADTRKALAAAAVDYYGHPSGKMNLVGVTGTNGKTTTTYLIKSALEAEPGHKVGIIGTIENRIGDKVLHTERTTPESLELQALFAEMLAENVTDTAMEVSSHSLALCRVFGCDFKIGVFTNLTQDHLDYHKTMENYQAAKGILFEMCEKAVINIDDPAGGYMMERAAGKELLTVAIDQPADIRAEDIHITADGVSFAVTYQHKKYEAALNIPGTFSIYNALGAIGACLFLGIGMETILQGLKNNGGVPGRFQTIKSRRGFNAIVDYAHTPDGLENILSTAREFVTGRIITVFGCGGDRDRTKRPVMGGIAGKLSDYCIITSDNPRTEDPLQILLDVEEGTKQTGRPYEKQVDRKQAILQAIAMAKPGDVVVVAGKGHENYQIFKDKTIHFDDAEVIRTAFEEDKK